MEKEIREYDDLLDITRFRNSTINRDSIVDQFYSDRSRIVYSSSFRRLQQKAQVFSLEPNASVRTRLTHSLEVSDLGKTLALKIANRLCSEERLNREHISAFVSVVENACLLHDIGNPPFGHFGETAIRDWTQKRITKYALPEDFPENNVLFTELIEDFKEFDGNPQGFRNIVKLHSNTDEYGMNLTYATLMCALKYTRCAGEEGSSGIRKKAGFFNTEKDRVETLYKSLNICEGCRYPLTYIMEAADDIAYCMSDIADGIEKGILSEKDFINAFKEDWGKKYPDEDCCVSLINKEHKGFDRDISIPWSRAAINEATDNFFLHEKEIFTGELDSLINKQTPMGKVLDTMKSVSKRLLYISPEAENIELVGYAVITGILRNYERLLKMSIDSFNSLLDENNARGNDIERRLFHRLGKRYIEAYKSAVDNINVMNEEERLIKEWWLRVHLVIDHISGMTDEYALETYQMLEGINLMRQ